MNSYGDKERERFIDEFYPLERIQEVSPELKEVDYPELKAALLVGLTRGVEDFLTENEEDELYRSDLHAFGKDDSTRYRLEEALEDIDLEDPATLARDVCETYRMFVYNESRDKATKSLE